MRRAANDRCHSLAGPGPACERLLWGQDLNEIFTSKSDNLAATISW